MAERPILMSAPMVRATLREVDPKTQTRRAIKLPHNNPLGKWEPTTVGGDGSRYSDGTLAPERAAIWHTRTGDCISCPYGRVGDRLWVRESIRAEEDENGRYIDYLADSHRACVVSDMEDNGSEQFGRWMKLYCYGTDDPDSLQQSKIVPSIHMPRWASRITLELTAVRVERARDCSEADAIAEGVQSTGAGRYWIAAFDCGFVPRESAVLAYRDLFESINGPGSWDCWVWALTFKRVELANGAGNG